MTTGTHFGQYPRRQTGRVRIACPKGGAFMVACKTPFPENERMPKPQPTVRDIEELVAFLPRLYGRNATPTGKLTTGKRTADGTLVVPWYEYSETVESFFDTIRRQGCWLDPDYDPEEDQKLLMDETALARATIPELRRLLTLVVRGERFCDGWWASMIEEGHVRRLLERLADIDLAGQADTHEERFR